MCNQLTTVHRNPLKKVPEQIPGEQPARRGDEQTQPQPGEAQASEPITEAQLQQVAHQAEEAVE